MRRNGFTLIELLAVIVILAVLMMISMPIILGVIETTKKSALKESANSLIEEAGYYYMQYGIEDNVRFDIDDNKINDINGKTLLLTGNIKDATVLINTKGEVALCINDGNYSVYKNYKDSKLIEVDNKNCNIPIGQSIVFLENESTIIEYTNEELTTLIISLQQEITELKNNTDSTPVGTVISYLGNHAPTGYLECNGTIYNISDYPKLAEQIKQEFGSYNYYGGDGTTTFAVPDLRGEFLRGTGTATRDTGSGANVGVHQDGTDIPIMFLYASNNIMNYLHDAGRASSNGSLMMKNFDKLIPSVGEMSAIRFTGSSLTTSMNGASYSVRPTNTSVLYCIKY